MDLGERNGARLERLIFNDAQARNQRVVFAWAV
jgi:hypothetical protein